MQAQGKLYSIIWYRDVQVYMAVENLRSDRTL